MITKNKIIDIWKNEGWSNVTKYHNTLASGVYKESPKFDLLHPDKVSPKAFWKASDVWFSTDTVCNTKNDNSQISDVAEANASNHMIPLFSGLLGFTELAIYNACRKFSQAKIAEIGCGYGSFYENFVKKFDRSYVPLEYIGFDVVKRFDQCVEVEGKDGTFTKKQVAQYKHKFNIFYSCNVFQHLSPKKIKKYLKQMFEMLPLGGNVVLSYVKDAKTSYHYGQVVEIIPLKDFYKICEDVGFTIDSKIEQSIKGNNTFNIVGVLLTKIINNAKTT